jgi:hypothetical protein
MMFAVGISMAVIAAGMVIFILLYRTSNDASKQIRVQRKADILVERLARGPYGGYGGIRGAYVNSQLPGNALPNPVGGTVNALAGSNVHQTLSYYAQTNFANFVHLGTPVTSLANFLTQHTTNAGLYTIGYDSTNRWIYYAVNGGSELPIVDLEEIDLDYLSEHHADCHFHEYLRGHQLHFNQCRQPDRYGVWNAVLDIRRSSENHQPLRGEGLHQEQFLERACP